MASDRLTITVEEAAARLGISLTLAHELVGEERSRHYDSAAAASCRCTP